MMQSKAAICGLVVLFGVALLASGDTEVRGRHRRTLRARRRHAAAPSLPSPPASGAEQQEENLQREYDQDREEDVAQQPMGATGAPGSGGIHAALRDLADATTIKGQFNEFLARVSDDTSKLHEEVRKKDAQVEDLEAKASDLQLRAKAAEAENDVLVKRIQHELQVREVKYEKALRGLQSQNELLTKTNLKLVGTNDDLTKDLEEEKARNHRLVSKLQSMAATFTEQQKAVQQMVAEGAQKVVREAQEEQARETRPETTAAVAARQVEDGQVVDDVEQEGEEEEDNGSEISQEQVEGAVPAAREAGAAAAAAPTASRASSRKMRAKVPKPASSRVPRPAAFQRSSASKASKSKGNPMTAPATVSAIQKKGQQHDDPQNDASLAALQDVGNMLKDVDDI